MFVGHGLVAFALVASAAAYADWPSDRALAVGVVAGLFATLPDVDMVYAVGGLVGGLEGVFAASDAFWAAAHEVHRGVTHSLVVGAVAAAGFAGWRARADLRLGVPGVLALLGLVAVVTAVGGPVTGAILTLFVLCGLGIVAVAAWLGFGARAVFAASLVGLLTHPFGDLLTGTPPALLYPLDVAVIGGRVTLHADPTLHLLGAFFVELATIWVALAVITHIRGSSLGVHARPRAALGAVYAVAVLAIPAPTLELSSPFVFTVLAVGAVGVPLWQADRTSGSTRANTALTSLVTALTAVTLAAFAYTGAYLVVGA